MDEAQIVRLLAAALNLRTSALEVLDAHEKGVLLLPYMNRMRASIANLDASRQR